MAIPLIPQKMVPALAAATLIFAAGAPATAQQGGPRPVVEAYQASLLTTMKQAKQLGFRGRVQAMAPAVRQAYDLAYVARRAAGRHWRKFTAAQKQRYVAAFSRLSIANHAARFNGYSGESFRITGVEDPGRGYRLVKTELVRPSGGNVSIAYLMQQRGGRWKIIDVFLKGTISEVATRRAEFASLLAGGGVDALIRSIERKAASAGAS